jgi:hypothetical protein
MPESCLLAAEDTSSMAATEAPGTLNSPPSLRGAGAAHRARQRAAKLPARVSAQQIP